MRLHGPDEPVYTIGVVARLLGINPQSLRQFEREGLVAPTRTEANIRLYSQNELIVLRRICELVKIEGVNIAGVRTILRIERRYGVFESTGDAGEADAFTPARDRGTGHDSLSGDEGDDETEDRTQSQTREGGSTHRNRGGWGLYL